MLKRLFIKHFVLVDTLSVEFDKGLNIITGETGAGKTAILDAIALILGMRADSSLIRKGENKATIEAAFEMDDETEIAPLLEEAGITHDPNEWLNIRRELVREGKNRAFINGQGVPLPLLQQVGARLIDLFSQHSHQTLRQTTYHHQLLDLFGNLKDDLHFFQETLKEEKGLLTQIEELQVSKERKEKEISYNSHVVDEIEGADLKEGEDETLFEEYSRCAHASELSETLSSAVLELTESPESLLTRLRFWTNRLDPLTSIDKALETPLSLLFEAGVNLNEAARELSSRLSEVDTDPLRMDLLKQRLSSIDTLKKKYGKTYLEIEETRKAAQATLDHYRTLDDTLAELTEQHQKKLQETDTLAQTLTKKRKTTAAHLAPLVTNILHTLNMEGSHFEIRLTPTDRTQSGDEEIAFFLKANSGEQTAPVSSRSSGGELARLMLAITTLLAEKNQTETLLFDEIDANIGGETATKIGRALSDLGKSRQVICVTHFPQVATHAHTHFRVKKQEIDRRTLATIDKLNAEERTEELSRMLGGAFPKTHIPVSYTERDSKIGISAAPKPRGSTIVSRPHISNIG